MSIELELQKFFDFCAAHLPVRLDIETKFLYFFIFDLVVNNKNQEFRLYICLTDECAAQKIKNFSSSSLWIISHIFPNVFICTVPINFLFDKLHYILYNKFVFPFTILYSNLYFILYLIRWEFIYF